MRSIVRATGLVLLATFVSFAQAPPQPAQAQQPAAPGAPGAARGARGGRGGAGNPFAGQKRIRALVISGGCCHDYRGEDKILMDVFADKLPVDWTILYEGGTAGDVKVALYDQPGWAKGFDLVIHNECYANISDEKFIKQITDAHKAGVPSMVFHCSLHSYRASAADDWREFLGVTSRRHTMAHNIAVKFNQESPITKGLPEDFKTPTDELYVIEKVWPNTKALATAVSPEEGNAVYPVVWTSEYYGARVFGTSLGHAETWNEPVFRDLLVRGFKWAINRE